jgi:UDP:flavonoid glycosyltransferase YjiC (YdhE family)
MIELLREWRPDLVVREELEFASLVAAERLGVRHVQVMTGLLSSQTRFRPMLSGAVNGLLLEAGVRAERAILDADEPRWSLTPPSLEDPDDRLRAERFRALDSAPPRMSNPERPLVFLTFGSEAASQRFFPDLYRAAINALADGSADVLVAVGLRGEPAALEPLPTGVRVERWVDQAEVLPRAALVVCHGGYGTMIGALAAGTPLVVVPLFAADQWMNGGRIAEVGAGLALDGAADQARLPEAVFRVLREPAFGQRAQAFAREIAALPPAKDAITALEALARPG